MSLDVLTTPDILEEIPRGIILVNNSGYILYANKFARSFAVHSKVEGQQLSYCYPYLANINKNGETCVEANVSNELYYLRVNKVVFAKHKKTLITFIDETSQIVLQQENQRLRDNLFLYENLLNSIDEGILAVDKYGNILFMNNLQEKIDNLCFQKVQGSPLIDHYDLDEKTSLLLRTVKTGRKMSRQPQYYLTGGKHTVNIVTSCSPIFHDNEIIGAVSISQDFNVEIDLMERIYNSYHKNNAKNAGEALNGSDTKKKLKNGTRYTFDNIIGKSELIRDAIENARRAAISSSNVLIYGDTGTGKELFAQSIHNESPQKNGPFIAINCAALPDTLLESILFGTVKGAYTGAVDRPGLFEEANGGTLFLDEINSMPLYMQPKLLRVLQEGTIRRIGGTKEIKVSTRIISSINVDPQKAIEKEQIRSDLYYRLAVVPIFIPPLSSRTDDIPILTTYFIKKCNKKLKMNVKRVSQKVMDLFMLYHWPGNVRELEHIIEGAMSTLPEDETIIDIEHLPKTLIDYHNHDNQNNSVKTQTLDKVKPDYKKPLLKTLKENEKHEIIKMLKSTKGNISQSARRLGMSRQNLQYKIKRYNIPLEKIRDSI